MTHLHTALEIFLGQEAFTDDRERQLRALADAIPLIVWTAARRLRASIRATDTLARLGGDEFTIILEEFQNPSDAEKVASKIIENVRPERQLDDVYLKVTTTIGIAYYQAQWNVEQLLDMADKAMYRAKQAGRNRIGL